MDTLPVELLLNIFSLVAHHQPWLAACNRVSKQWHLLTKEPLYREPKLWHIKALESFVQTVADSQETTFAQNENSSLKNYFTASNGSLVKSIDLSMLPHRWESVHVGLVQGLVQGCPFVTKLNLTDCALLRDNAIQLIAETLGPQRLRSLVLSGCVRITDVAILSLCAHAIQLENLDLSGCIRISDISVRELGVATVPRNNDPTRSSNNQDYKNNDNYDQIIASPSSVAVDRAQGVSHSLRSLDLSQCIRITDSGIRALRAGATQLTSLNLEGCYGILLDNDDLDTNEWEDIDDDDFFEEPLVLS
ncbi:hypothetical protein BGW38_008908 [Lunasporangiospora selenospora]|uniref:F-box domain-containing protein n=1 Tax=Lunasporangiospora selenospora TaxID=979761 RepID=A0A9P6FXX6_9FUNG|nr:hypothetical protein BGW38_008908 [Lunasporangiospora selenospora]